MHSFFSPENKSRLSLIFSMVIFGTIGIFRRYLPLPSGTIAMARGIIGTLALLLIVFLSKKGLHFSAIRKNLPLLCLSGAAIGVNWILLFEAYNHTTVATATLCYYMAPILVILASPLLLRERVTLRQWICVCVALCGMVLVSGVASGGIGTDLLGILMGLGAAVLYASVVLMNKFIKEIPAYDKTIVQLGCAAMVLLPYVLLAEEVALSSLTLPVILILLGVGVLHTGIAYALYFGSIEKLSARTVAIFSYIDPVVAILLSALLLREPMGVWEITGAILILGATVVGEWQSGKKKAK